MQSREIEYGSWASLLANGSYGYHGNRPIIKVKEYLKKFYIHALRSEESGVRTEEMSLKEIADLRGEEG